MKTIFIMGILSFFCGISAAQQGGSQYDSGDEFPHAD